MPEATHEVEARHLKQLAVMRGWLEGKGFYSAADALELVRTLEQGYRKDKVTPKFHHQLSVARFVTTIIPHLMFPEETVIAALLHDLLEDHSEWTVEMVAERFGQRVADAVWALTKKHGGLVKSYESYFAAIALDPIASIVKPIDRGHNLQTMQGVFTLEKQAAYVTEVDTYFFPLIRASRRRFNRQYPAYENIKILLRCQTRLIRYIHEAAQSLVAPQ